jgi:hypothetical protein
LLTSKVKTSSLLNVWFKKILIEEPSTQNHLREGFALPDSQAGVAAILS